MPNIRANGITIEYESFGPIDSEPILLIAGMGAQLMSWDASFCKILAALGFRVIRFENLAFDLSSHPDKRTDSKLRINRCADRA